MNELKKVLFIDRDGTILIEPEDKQIDSLEKFAFVPGAISGLKALTGLGYWLWQRHQKRLVVQGG